MSSRRRLMQKIEGLNDDTIAFLETQIDLLLTMPAHCRRDQWHLALVERLDQIQKRPAMARLVPVRRGARR